jgi:hypothetical protein
VGVAAGNENLKEERVAAGGGDADGEASGREGSEPVVGSCLEGAGAKEGTGGDEEVTAAVAGSC